MDLGDDILFDKVGQQVIKMCKNWAKKRPICIVHLMVACLDQIMPDSIEKVALRLVCINVTGSVAGALAPRYGAHLTTFGAQCSEH